MLLYAALYWPEYARSLACSEDTFDLSLSFYYEKSQICEYWPKTYRAVVWKYDDPLNSFTLLHLASYFGILPLAENLLLKKGWLNKMKRKLYLNKTDDSGRMALIWAAQSGHDALVRLLSEKGADFEAKNIYGETALYKAAQCGHEAVVRLLLKKGADVEAMTGFEGVTALHAAAEKRHEAVVQLLLEKGADVKAKDKIEGTALTRQTKVGTSLW